jgi:hypothetical protein
MTTNRTLPLLLAALMAAPLACAQQGPVPGSDPASYAKDYYFGQVAQARNDTVGYAHSQASAQAAGNQTRTAAFIACWAAYDAVGMAVDPACAQFFTPPERAPRPHKADNTTEGAKDTLNATVAGAGAFANTTLDALNRTVRDPTQAPSQASRIVEATVGFITGTVALVVKLVKHIVGGTAGLVVGIVLGILHGLGLGMQGAGMAGGAVADAVRAVLKAAVDGAGAAAAGIGSLLKGLVDGLGAALAATAKGLVGAAQATAAVIAGALKATVAGAAAAGKATLDAASGAAQAVGHAIGSVVDGIAHLFGGGHSGRAAPSGPADGLGKGLPTDDLLGTVRKAVPL